MSISASNAADKLFCELHARVASEVHGVPITGCRFFNIYGPRQDAGSPYSGVISIFCERITNNHSQYLEMVSKQTNDVIKLAKTLFNLFNGFFFINYKTSCQYFCQSN